MMSPLSMRTPVTTSIPTSAARITTCCMAKVYGRQMGAGLLRTHPPPLAPQSASKPPALMRRMTAIDARMKYVVGRVPNRSERVKADDGR